MIFFVIYKMNHLNDIKIANKKEKRNECDVLKKKKKKVFPYIKKSKFDFEIINYFNLILFFFILSIINCQNYITIYTGYSSSSKIFLDSGNQYDGNIDRSTIKINGQIKTSSTRLFSFPYQRNTIIVYLDEELASIANLFENFKILLEVDLSQMSGRNVINAGNMFLGCSSLTSVKFGSFITSGIKYMDNMFNGCTSLKHVDFEKFNTNSLLTINNMFQNCASLTYLDLSKFSTSKIENMENMFKGCSSLKYLDVSNFITTNVRNMNNMFNGCSSLTTLDLSNFKIPRVTSLYNIFSGCNSLISLDISNFGNSGITNLAPIFQGLNNLEYLDISNFITTGVTTMKNLFKGFNKLKKLDLSKFNTNKVKNMEGMFYGCSGLTELNINGLKTSKVEYMNDMFNGCSSLISLNLYSFITNEVKNMRSMFNNCELIISLDLSNFKTINVLDISYMFSNCSSLKNINLDNFDISKVTSVESIFSNCISLTQLNISHFDTSKVTYSMKNIFYNCINLEYINIKKFVVLDNLNIELDDDIIFQTPENIVACIGENQTKLKEIIERKNCPTISCEDSWRKYQKTIIYGTNICMENCTKLPEFKYIIDNKCYQHCLIIEFFQNLCKVNYEDKMKLIQDIISSITNGTLDELIKLTIGNKSNFIVQDNKDMYQLTTIEEQNKFENLSSIDFAACKNILKAVYNISQEDDILVFKIDHFDDEFNIPIIEYGLFTKDGKIQLNLSYCNNVTIDYYIPININENELFKYFSNNSRYYDLCHPDEENGADLTLYDRRNDYNKKRIICEANCNLKNYNFTTKKAVCDCKVKTEFNFYEIVKFDKNKLFDLFKNFKKISNIEIVLCYKLLLKKNSFIYNIGSYIISGCILINIIFSIVFCTKGNKNLKNSINLLFGKNKNQNKNHRKSKNHKIKKLTLNRHKIIKNKDSRESKSLSALNIISGFNSNENSKKIKRNISKKRTALTLINKKTKKFPKNKLNDTEKNSLPYKEALKFDKRTYFQYYLSLIRTKHSIVFTFITNNDYNSKSIKICIFFFNYCLSLSVNALFFNDNTMHRLYEDKGQYNIIYQLPQIIYSLVISSVIGILINELSLAQKKILTFKKGKKIKPENIKKLIKCLSIKFCIFFVLDFLFLWCFWYYISIFCALYKNTQLHLIKDCSISFVTPLFTSFLINLAPGIFRIPSLRAKKKDKEYMYKFSGILEIF